MDVFFFQLAIIFLPGLSWERIVAKYGLKRPPTQFDIALRTFTFGLTAYAITYGLYAICGKQFIIPELKSTSTFIADPKYIGQFITAWVVAIIGSVIWLYLLNYKILGKLLRRVKATKRYGEEDLWDYVFNSDEASVEYAYVRDYSNSKVYSGWVVGFSESDRIRELLMRDVEVYDLDSHLLYQSPLMYIGRNPDAMHIEFPFTGKSKEQEQ